MTIRQFTTAAILLLLTAGCSGPAPVPPPTWLSQANYDAVQNGMSLKEVEQKLGPWASYEPAVVMKLSGADKQVQRYHWNREGKNIEVNFIADKVVSKSAQGM